MRERGATTEGNHKGCPYMRCRLLGTLPRPTRSSDTQNDIGDSQRPGVGSAASAD